MAQDMNTAMVNRSIRTIKAELEYLCDASIITPHTLSEILTSIPAQTALHAPISVGAVPSALPMNNLNLNSGARTNGSSSAFNEKSDTSSYYQPPTPQPSAQAQAPPPAYNSPPPAANWPPLATATALYAYSSPDAGDLALQPNDQVQVTEYMNAEWWKGRNVRTGQDGIFPRSYVKVAEEKGAAAPAPAATGNNYGNMPLAVSGAGNGESKVPGKGQAGKFGKKLGNAAIFGAGATIGGNIVNSIF